MMCCCTLLEVGYLRLCLVWPVQALPPLPCKCPLPPPALPQRLGNFSSRHTHTPPHSHKHPNHSLRSPPQSIKGVLLKWAAWRLAIENSWGGPATAAKEDRLWENIAAYFSTGKEPHWDEVRPRSRTATKLTQNARLSLTTIQLAASIDVFTIDELNVEIDDGSLDGSPNPLLPAL